MIHTHQTAPTQFVGANGIRFAYRRFGKTRGVPIIFNQHYIGTMDYWDPTVADGLARDREVILFNNAGVSSSSGEVPTTFERMGANASAFIKALGLKQVDVLGFSIGGMVAQEITLQAPDLVRRLIVDGTGPRGGQGMELITQVAKRIFGAPCDPPEHIWLAVKFSPSAAGQAKGTGTNYNSCAATLSYLKCGIEFRQFGDHLFSYFGNGALSTPECSVSIFARAADREHESLRIPRTLYVQPGEALP